MPAYVALLGAVRERYPQAPIFTVTWAHWGGEHEQWVADAVSETGDANIEVVPFEIQNDEGFGCDYHPSAATHARLGEELTQVLQTKLGW